jgi:hypothetical protein
MGGRRDATRSTGSPDDNLDALDERTATAMRFM